MNTEILQKFVKTHKNFLIAFGVMLIAYYPSLLWMWGRWFSSDSYYSHGVLVPFVSLYLIWQLREKLAQIPVKPAKTGLSLIIGGTLFYLLCAEFRINFAAGYAMYIVFVGLLLHFFGWKICRKIAFPVFFLIFMLPLPTVVIVRLSWQLKMFAAQLATVVLNNLRVPAVQEGSIILMRHAEVVVDDVCSGLRSLIALAALGTLFAYWFKGPWYKKGILVLSTIPVAIVTNMMRVVILAMISEIWGAQYIEGFIHETTGYLIFVFAFLIMYFLCKVME